MLENQEYIVLLLEEEDEIYSYNRKNHKKNIWYFPKIIVHTKDIKKFQIKDIDNLKDVKSKINDYYKNKYISNIKISKPIINIYTQMHIEIWKSGINETFGNKYGY